MKINSKIIGLTPYEKEQYTDELSITDIREILKDSATNQKQFVENLSFDEFEEAIITLKDWYEYTGFNVDDIRGAINGGALFITSDTSEMSERDKDYIINEFDSGKLMVFDTRLY